MGLLDSFFKPDPIKLLKKGDTEGVVRALHHKDGKTRCLAAAALGEIKGDRAVEALGGALDDDDARVRFFVAGNLAKIVSSNATRALSSYKHKYCVNCAKTLLSAGGVRPLSRGFDVSDAVQHAAQVLSTAGRECQCGAIICTGCLPLNGARVTCQLCGASV